MRGVLAAAALAASLAPVAPAAAAGPVGDCSGSVDVLCVNGECVPDYPCGLQFCIVYVKPDCL